MVSPLHIARTASLVNLVGFQPVLAHAVFIVGARYISPESSCGRGMPRPYRSASAGILVGKPA